MRCTDLQINDWVYLSEKSRYPMQVRGVNESDCLLDFDGNEGDPFDGIYGEGGIAPIELTAEMLKRNKWESLYGRYWENIKVTEFSISQYGAEFRCCLGYDNELTFFRYVHELQHLLRLCGYDDLADDFKIE